LLDEKRADYFPHAFIGNISLVLPQRTRHDWTPAQVTSTLGCRHLDERGANVFPLHLKNTDPIAGGKSSNVSAKGLQYLTQIGGGSAEDLFYHAIAIMHAPDYRVENTGALRQDWPRIPLPANAEALSASAALGQQIAALLDSEQAVPGVTSGKLRDDLRGIGMVERVGGGQLDPDTDFAVRAGWGHAGKGGVTMPGNGTYTERAYTADESARLDIDLLGETTFDIALNQVAQWRNIPKKVWTYTIGGYQMIKKWLSYCELALLGRPLRMEEVEEVTHIARRIAAILLLTRELDANYAAVKAESVWMTWSRTKT